MSFKAFYDECSSLGLLKLSTNSQREKAKLVALKYGIDEKDIKNILAEQEKIFMDALRKQDDEAARIEYEKELEVNGKEQEKMLEPYPYFGREKRIAYFQEKIDNIKNKIFNIDQAIEKINKNKEIYEDPKNYTQRKQDWAIAGGIANALGGVGAGFMAASEVQAKNAMIEQQNKDNIKLAVQLQFNLSLKENELKEERKNLVVLINDYSKNLNNVKTNLIEEIDGINPIDLIKITYVKLSNTEYNAKICLKKEKTIFDDISAVIDGSFWAHVYQEKDYVGSIRIVLPLEGIGTKNAKISVSTHIGIDPNKPYFIEYESEKMWFIEKYIQ